MATFIRNRWQALPGMGGSFGPEYATDDRWMSKSGYGMIMCYLSDDNGKSWHRSKTVLDGVFLKDHLQYDVMLQEPGVVELNDGRLMMFCRSDAGYLVLSWSEDCDESWTPCRMSNIVSPLSPASIERIPNSDTLLMVWNNHSGVDTSLTGKRTPLFMAVSGDDGQTWEEERVLENNPNGWYCYTAIHFARSHVLLGYCAGDRRENNGLAETRVVRIPLKWLYSHATAD
ncbi:hypothetical protein GF406_05915 [candidate division KSB1 bacterium]|nr:hypothetical protein [candidate division KSB1 bacterium]